MALMRGRDVRDKLRGKIDPELLHTLEVMCEQDAEIKQQVKAVMLLMLQFQDVLINFGTALAAIGAQITIPEKVDLSGQLSKIEGDGST